MLAFIDQFVIGFVAEQVEVVTLGKVHQCFHQCAWEDGAGGVGRAVDNQRLGMRRHQALQLAQMGQPAGFRMQAIAHGLRADAGEHVGVHRPGRVRDQHLVARPADDLKRGHERACAASRDADLFRAGREAVDALHFGGQRLAQREQPRRGAIGDAFALNRFQRGPANMLWRAKVRLAQFQTDAAGLLTGARRDLKNGADAHCLDGRHEGLHVVGKPPFRNAAPIRSISPASSAMRGGIESTMINSPGLCASPPETPSASSVGIIVAVVLPSEPPPVEMPRRLIFWRAASSFARLKSAILPGVASKGRWASWPVIVLSVSGTVTWRAIRWKASSTAAMPGRSAARMSIRAWAWSGTTLGRSPPPTTPTLTVTPGIVPLSACKAMIWCASSRMALRPFCGSTPAWAETPRTSSR